VKVSVKIREPDDCIIFNLFVEYVSKNIRQGDGAKLICP